MNKLLGSALVICALQLIITVTTLKLDRVHGLNGPYTKVYGQVEVH